MIDHSADDSDAFVAAFLRQVAEDRTRGAERPLAEYLACFPGHEAAIARAFAELGDEATNAGEVTPAGVGPLGNLGPYALLREIGRGGQGEVYLAEDTRLHRNVAIKLLRGFGAAPSDQIDRFRREAELASRLSHPNICTIHETGSENGTPFIVMRFVEGESLASRIARERERAAAPSTRREQSGSTPATRRDDLFRQVEIIETVARAVHAAHEGGIIHRDLKPANIMIATDGTPVILDFGLARDVDADTLARTRTGDVFGTPAYIAPEQLETPPHLADRRSDVYALGVTLFETLTSRRPFEAPTREGLYQAVLAGRPSDPRALNPAIPADLRLVILTAIERDRNRRYQTAADLAEDLRRIRGREPILARPIGPILRLRRWVTREPMRAAFLSLLLVVAAASGFFAARWPSIRADMELAREREKADRVDRFVERGYLHLTTQAYDAALKEFRAAQEVDADDPEMLCGIALTLVAQDRAGEALALLDSRRELEGRANGLRIARILVLERAGRKAEADALRTPQQGPADPLALFLLANSTFGNRPGTGGLSPKDGIVFMQHCFAAGGRRAVYYYAMATLIDVAGDQDSATQFEGVIRSRFPDDVRSNLWIAVMYRVIDPDRCLEAIAKAEGDPAIRVQVARVKAGALTEKGRFDEAVGILTQLCKEEATDASIRFDLAYSLTRAGRREEAEQAYRDCLVIEPKRAGAHNNLANLLKARGDVAGAIREYKLAAQHDPRFPNTWNNLAILLCDQDRIEEAEIASRRAAELAPGAAEIHNTASRIAHARSDDALAEKHAREALRIKPDFAEAFANLGMALDAQGQPREAVEMFTRALALANGNPGFASAAASKKACEAIVPLVDRFERYLSREFDVGPARECLFYGEVARRRGHYRLGLALMQQALSKDPSLALSLSEAVRISAAKAALRAAELEDGSERAALRVTAVQLVVDEFDSVVRRVEDAVLGDDDMRLVLRLLRIDHDLRLMRDDAIDQDLPADLASRRRAVMTRVKASAPHD